MQHLLKSEDLPGFSSKVELHKSFFNKIKFPNGKADLAGVIIFSEILACFQNSDNVSKIQNEGFLLEKSYADFAKEFEITKRQVSDAILRLEKLGLIKRVILTIYKNKRAYPNSIFIELPKKYHEFLNIEANQESKEGRGGVSVNSLRPNFFCPYLTLKQYIPLERGPSKYINNNTNSIKINKQTNTCMSFFNKKDFKDLTPTPKPFREPTLIEELRVLPVEWKIWAQEKFSWDEKILQSELNRFFNHHKKSQSLYGDWFEAWKGWCRLSFNAKKPVSHVQSTCKSYDPSDQAVAWGDMLENTEHSQTNNDPILREIREKLLEFGISSSKATLAVETMAFDRILKAIAYVNMKMGEGVEIKNKAGYLWKALQDNYAKEFEEIKGEVVPVQKTPMMLEQEEKSLVCEIEERQGSELNKKLHKTFLKTFGLTAYKTWFKEVSFNQTTDNAITLKSPSNFYRDWLSTHMRYKIEEVFKNLFSEGVHVKFVA